MGNTLYGLSILLKNPEWDQGEKSYLVHHLPWLIGSLGTLTLDLVVSFFKKKRGAGGSKTQLQRWGLWGVCSPTYMPHFRQACTCSLSGLVTACVGTSCVVRAPPMLMGNEDVSGDKTGAQLH